MFINRINSNDSITFNGSQKILYSRELIKQYASTDMSATQIAKKMNASPDYIRKIMRSMGLGFKERFGDIIKKGHIDSNELKAQVDAGKSLHELAKFFDVSVGRIRQSLASYGFKTKSSKALDDMPIEKIKRLINEDYSQAEIEDILGFPRGTLTYYFKKHNLSTKANAIVESLSKEDFAEFLKPGVNINTLSYTFRVSRATIVKMLEKHGLSLHKNELELAQVRNLINQGYTLAEIREELQCSYARLKEFMVEHNLSTSNMSINNEKRKIIRVPASHNQKENTLLKQLDELIDNKQSVDEIANTLQISSDKIDDLLFRYNRAPMHLENYECFEPIDEKGRFKILIKEGDSSVQIAEIYGVSSNKVEAWLKECCIEAPESKLSPNKEEIIKVLEHEKTLARQNGKIYNFGKSLNISNASFEYLVEKYGLEELYWRVKYNI